jgi:DNA-binding FadR family transcriptional regulator
MYTLIYRLFFFALDRMGSVRANVQDHRDILEAVKMGNGRDAERLIQQHITHFQRMVEELL